MKQASLEKKASVPLTGGIGFRKRLRGQQAAASRIQARVAATPTYYTTIAAESRGDGGLTYSGGLRTATIISTTNLNASGSITAATFHGDGSHLTGISAQSDRIISGTTSMVANGATSIISITSGGVTAGYFNSNGEAFADGYGGEG